NQDKVAWFSNRGTKSVHVAAPGTSIWSTGKRGGYMFMHGTSMAAPHVSGLAALLLSVHPDMEPNRLREVLIQSSTAVPALKEISASGGRVNASSALKMLNGVELIP